MFRYLRIFLVVTLLVFVASLPPVSRKKNQTSLESAVKALQKFGTIRPAWASAAGHAPFTYMRSVRESIGFVMGYANAEGDTDFYAQVACPLQDPAPAIDDDCTDAPPRAGLVYVAADMVSNLNTMLTNAGVTSCSAIPSSGEVALTTPDGTSVTGTYLTPTLSVPAGWDNGGEAFSKAIKLTMSISGISTLMLAEFSCGKPAVYVKLNMIVGAHAPGYERRINIVSGAKAGLKMADVFITEYHPGNDKVRGAYAITTEINESLTTFKTRGIVSGNSGNIKNVFQINAHGNYSTHETSVYLKNFTLSNGNQWYDEAELASLSGASSAAYSATGSYAIQDNWCQPTSYTGGYPNCDGSIAAQTAGNIIERQACIDLDLPNVAPGSASLCDGLTLEDPSAPTIDPSAVLSPNWAISTMQSKIDISGVEL